MSNKSSTSITKNCHRHMTNSNKNNNNAKANSNRNNNTNNAKAKNSNRKRSPSHGKISETPQNDFMMEQILNMRNEACPAILYLMRQKNRHLKRGNPDLSADQRLEDFYHFAIFLKNFVEDKRKFGTGTFVESCSADYEYTSDDEEDFANLKSRWCPSNEELDQIEGYVHGTDDGRIIPGVPVDSEEPSDSEYSYDSEDDYSYSEDED